MGQPSARDAVHRDDFEKVLKLLVEPSPWKPFIEPNIKIALANRGSPLFDVVNLKDYTPILQRLSPRSDPSTTPGVTDKPNGRIIMHDKLGQNTGNAMIGHALHEAVHFVSYPPGKATKGSAARPALGDGLFEGLVECVTEDILMANVIELADGDNRGHAKRVPVVRNLFKVLANRTPKLLPVPFFGRLLFSGDITEDYLKAQMHFTFTKTGWAHIRNLTGANQPDAAIGMMNKYSAELPKRLEKEAELIEKHMLKQLQLRMPDIAPDVMPGAK